MISELPAMSQKLWNILTDQFRIVNANERVMLMNEKNAFEL